MSKIRWLVKGRVLKDMCTNYSNLSRQPWPSVQPVVWRGLDLVCSKVGSRCGRGRCRTLRWRNALGSFQYIVIVRTLCGHPEGEWFRSGCGARLETTGEAITNIKSKRRVKTVGKDEGRRRKSSSKTSKIFAFPKILLLLDLDSRGTESCE